MSAKLLVVSDSPTQRMMWQLALESEGFTVISAGDGLSGLNRVYMDAPALVLSDVVLPHLNGYQFCRLVKNDIHTRHIPIILLTSLEQKTDSFWGLEAGADLYLNKQSNLEPVIETIKQKLAEAETSGSGNQSGMTQVFAPLFTETDAKARLSTLLDQILFKTTVRGAVRVIARDVYDPSALHQRLFELLGRMFDYSVAMLVVSGRQATRILVAPQIAVTTQDINVLCDKVQDQKLQGEAGWQKLDIAVFNPEIINEEAPSVEFLSEIDVDFEIDQGIDGSLALYCVNEGKYNEETQDILSIISDELALILRSFTKHDEVEKLKADFTAMLVHDLRSPLTTIIGFSELMLVNKANEPLSEWQRDRVARINRQGKDLLALISNLLDLSKLEAGRVTLELGDIEIEPLLTRIEHNVSVLTDAGNITFDLDVKATLPTLRADETQIKRVIMNLVSNAIKFTPKEGRITVSAAPVSSDKAADKADLLLICVADTGAGIPQDKIDNLFGKYQQAHGYLYDGTGLGLAISKEIVEAHQGYIWLESIPGKGTMISLVLPVEGPAGAGSVGRQWSQQEKDAIKETSAMILKAGGQDLSKDKSANSLANEVPALETSLKGVANGKNTT